MIPDALEDFLAGMTKVAVILGRNLVTTPESWIPDALDDSLTGMTVREIIRFQTSLPE